jgi:hypothetical protein
MLHSHGEETKEGSYMELHGNTEKRQNYFSGFAPREVKPAEVS